MTSLHHISLAVGAASGAATSILQNSPTPTNTAMLVPIVSAAIGAVFSYAVLKTTVQVMERDLQQMRKDVGQIYDLTRDLAVKVAKIEGELERPS